jgi:hypothetical protein
MIRTKRRIIRMETTMWRRLLIALATLSLPGLAAAEPVSVADLQGMTLEANWIENMMFRPEKEKTPRKTTSPRQVTLTFGADGAITHRMVRVAGKNSRTENRQMTIGRSQPTGIGFVRWALEDGKLVYIETLYSGARRLIVSLDKQDGKLTCAISAMVAREGDKPVLTLSLANDSKVELLDVKASGGDCSIIRP